MKYQIGQKYTDRNGRDCTIIDILTTKNSKGEIIKERYVSEHIFMGRSVTDNDVLEITVSKALSGRQNQ